MATGDSMTRGWLATLRLRSEAEEPCPKDACAAKVITGSGHDTVVSIPHMSSKALLNQWKKLMR